MSTKIAKLESAIAKEKMTKLQKLELELKKEKAKQLYLVFMSPGSFVANEEIHKVKTKDIKAAIKSAKAMKRSGSPYGFYYKDGNGKQVGLFYYITGTLLRYDKIPETNENQILRSNMSCNDWPIVVENHNSYRIARPFGRTDAIVDWDGNITTKGNNKELTAYRSKFLKDKKTERKAFERKLKHA